MVPEDRLVNSIGGVLVGSTVLHDVSAPPRLYSLADHRPTVGVVVTGHLSTRCLSGPLLGTVKAPAPGTVPSAVSDDVVYGSLLAAVISSTQGVLLVIQSIRL